MKKLLTEAIRQAELLHFCEDFKYDKLFSSYAKL